MLNIFRDRIKARSKDLKKEPLEVEIKDLISKISQKEYDLENTDFNTFSSALKNIPQAEIFSLSNGSDEFTVSIFLLNNTDELRERIIKELNVLSGLEVLYYEYSSDFYNESIWSHSNNALYASSDKSLFISKNEMSQQNLMRETILITKSREFLFGTLFFNGFTQGKTTIEILYRNLIFNHQYTIQSDSPAFSSVIQIGDLDFSFLYILENASPSTSQLIKELIKEQRKRLEDVFQKKTVIKQAGLFKQELKDNYSGFTLEGTIYTPGTDVDFKVIFPKKIINLFPDYSCTTAKGKILQINKDLLRREFSTFYKSSTDFLFGDYLSILDERDLNLICQNFLLSHKYDGDKIKRLFYFRIRLEENSRILKMPLSTINRFLSHLPLNLLEQYRESKAYSETLENMIDYQKLTMVQIYKDLNEKKLLLSYKSQYLLNKELGKQEKENKTRRLRKLVGDKRYINYLDHMEHQKAQILLSNIKNVLIVDTFIYQEEELNRLKPYLSKRRFQELREDIRFTQSKIKSNQIDINRICDSIELFNSDIRDFVKNEKRKNV